MFMLNAAMPAALPGRPAVGTGNAGSGSTVGDGQGRALMDASGAVQLGVAQAADARGGALTAADTHVAAAIAVSTGDQPTQGSADASSAAALVAQLPGGNPQAATAPDTLRLPNGDPSQWRQTLGEALGDRIVLQRDKGSDQATIRLDPPAMGQIEISIRHEAGALKVSIAATHIEVLNQLRGVGEALRQDLEQKHQGEVTVQFSQSGTRLSGDDGRGGSGGGREQARRDPGRALTDESGEATAGFHLEGDEA
jgi:flagellar hook-length control protein FliK